MFESLDMQTEKQNDVPIILIANPMTGNCDIPIYKVKHLSSEKSTPMKLTVSHISNDA